jgi:hypothetical protein
MLVHASAIAQPAVQGVSPQAVIPGQTTEILLRGSKLTPPITAKSNLPLQIEVLPAADEKKAASDLRLKITVPADAQPQVGGLFVATGEGLSDPIFLMIDDLPSVADAGQNHARDKAQPLTLPCAVDGVADGAMPDVYKFNAAAGQRLAIEVLATRLGSELDPIIRLSDHQGRELAVADDDLCYGAEPRLAHTFAADGEYYLELRDVRYRGGPAMRYRLRLGDFPIAAPPFPLALSVGQSGSVSVIDLGTKANLAFSLEPAATESQRQALALRSPQSNASALATLITSSHVQVTESEPSSPDKTAAPLAIPCGINGRFAAPKEIDKYTFTAQKDSLLLFRPLTRSLASPAYVRLSIVKPDGSLLAEAPVTDADEQPLAVTIPADGDYQLVVEELLGRGGAEYVYHIAADYNPGAALLLKADKNAPHKFTLPQSGAIAIEVQASRQGYDGPITLEVTGAEGLTIANHIIAEKQAATKLILAAPMAKSGKILSLRMRGTYERAGKICEVPLSTTGLIRAQWPHLAYPPAWLDGLVPVAITGEAASLFAVTPGVAEIKLAPGGQVMFALELKRENADFKDPLLILPGAIPSGITSEIKREGNGPEEKYQVTLKAAADVAVAKYELAFTCYGEAKGRGQLVRVALPLEITAPTTEEGTTDEPK